MLLVFSPFLVIACASFTLTFLVVLACIGLGFSYFKQKQKQQIKTMLHKAEAASLEEIHAELIRPADDGNALTRVLENFKFSEHLNLIIEQAGSDWTASKLIAVSAVLAIVGVLLGLKLAIVSAQLSALVLGGIAGIAPLLLVLRKRSKTMSEFEEQLPDALDFLSRSMRAGHGFSVALEMLSLDSPDPLGRAFRRVSNELALGSSLETALGKLIHLMPLVDVRFFVSSVVLQQETGGNLGEILTKLAYIIRERFHLKGQVKAVSAHGRITGLVLLLMPVGVAAFLLLTNPKYLADMNADSTGRMLIYGAVGGQVLGYFVIKKIIDIKV